MTQLENLNVIQAVNRAIHDAMLADPKVLVLGEEVGDKEGGGVVGATKGLSTKFGDDRVRSTPISEQAIIGAAIGASLAGYRPVAEIMLMNFMPVAMDMITNHAAKLRFMSGGQTNVPIVIRTMTGVGLGTAGQHADYLEAWFAHTPGLKVVAPSTPSDAYGLMRAAIEDEDPVIFIENMASFRIAQPFVSGSVRIGEATIARSGTDVTVVAHSRMVHESLVAAESLAEQGISVEIVDLRSISPWDRNTVLASVEKTGRLLIVHEAVRTFGIGGEIAAEVSDVMFGRLKGPVKRLGGSFSPVPFSKPLESAWAPRNAEITHLIQQMVN